MARPRRRRATGARAPAGAWDGGGAPAAGSAAAAPHAGAGLVRRRIGHATRGGRVACMQVMEVFYRKRLEKQKKVEEAPPAC